jgi:hypothetical protein
MDDQLEERVATLERAVTDGEGDVAALTEAAVTAERLEALETAAGDLEDRVAELEAATQALRGYVGSVRSVNREVEERADLALSRVEALSGQQNTGDRPPARDRGGRDPEQGHQSEQPPSGDRCDRCGRPTGDGTGPEGPERGTPSATPPDRTTSVQAGEQTDMTDSTPGGGGPGPERRRGPAEPSWTDSVTDPMGADTRTGDGPDTDGPLGRLRRLL